MCSEIALHDGELVILSAHQDFEHGDCGVDCMLVNSTRVHGAGKLTSIPISGEEVLLCPHACMRKKGNYAFDKCPSCSSCLPALGRHGSVPISDEWTSAKRQFYWASVRASGGPAASLLGISHLKLSFLCSACVALVQVLR